MMLLHPTGKLRKDGEVAFEVLLSSFALKTILVFPSISGGHSFISEEILWSSKPVKHFRTSLV